MDAFLWTLLILCNVFSIGGLDLAASRSMNDLAIRVVHVLPSGSVTVEVTNTSTAPMKVWRDSNSWGAARWRVLILREGRVETLFQNPDQRFTRNIPVADKIAAGAHVRHTLDLNGGNWCGFGQCSSHDQRGIGGKNVTFQPKERVVVVYDVPRTEEAVRLHVWYGVAAASTTVE